MTKKILVLGSSNVDLLLRIPRFHQPGETITADNLVTVFGGKGANQAISAKRLGGEVSFITKLGNDAHGKSYLKYLVENGFPRRFLLRDRTLPTGIALIEVNPKGENRIIVSPGANGSLSRKDLQRFPQVWQGVNVLVVQLEIPLPTVKMALELAKGYGALNILNPSPAIPLPSELFSLVDFLVPNELEAQSLAGIKMKGNQDLPKIANKLLGGGAKNVLITRGRKGLFFKNMDEEIWMKAFRVEAVDSTAAGDAFMGALACGLSEGRPLRDVLRLANGAGALATTKWGAQPSLPSTWELQRFLSIQAKRQNYHLT